MHSRNLNVFLDDSILALWTVQLNIAQRKRTESFVPFHRKKGIRENRSFRIRFVPREDFYYAAMQDDTTTTQL